MAKKWERIGSIGNDAGMMMIVDPCYVLHREAHAVYEEFGRDWPAFCREVGIGVPGREGPICAVLGGVGGNSGMAAVVGSGYGDGVYDVFVKRGDEGRIAELRIRFM